MNSHARDCAHAQLPRTGPLCAPHATRQMCSLSQRKPAIGNAFLAVWELHTKWDLHAMAFGHAPSAFVAHARGRNASSRQPLRLRYERTPSLRCAAARPASPLHAPPLGQRAHSWTHITHRDRAKPSDVVLHHVAQLKLRLRVRASMCKSTSASAEAQRYKLTHSATIARPEPSPRARPTLESSS